MKKLLPAAIALYMLYLFLTSALAYDGRSEYDHDQDGAITLVDVGIVLAHVGERYPTCDVAPMGEGWYAISGEGWNAGKAEAKVWLEGTPQAFWYTTTPSAYSGHLYGAITPLAFDTGPGVYIARITQGSLVCRTEFVVEQA